MTDETRIPMPEKGKSIPLLYSREARQRIIVALNWDSRMQTQTSARKSKPAAPAQKQASPEEEGYENPHIHKVEGNFQTVTETYDLDLVCLIFDSEGTLIDAVSPDPQESIDRSGKIYHGGDETRGVGDTDDETISVELKDLPAPIHHLVFLAICQSGQSFEKIATPQARIMDGLTDVELLRSDLGKPGAPGKTACIIARLHRGGPEGWMIHNILEFRIDRKVEDWGAEVRPFLT
ncbi:MAG: TerD family protein [Rhodospirillales bacterium]|nr:TerD family protein [Rhodospirillales bacterium]